MSLKRVLVVLMTSPRAEHNLKAVTMPSLPEKSAGAPFKVGVHVAGSLVERGCSGESQKAVVEVGQLKKAAIPDTFEYH